MPRAPPRYGLTLCAIRNSSAAPASAVQPELGGHCTEYDASHPTTAVQPETEALRRTRSRERRCSAVPPKWNSVPVPALVPSPTNGTSTHPVSLGDRCAAAGAAQSASKRAARSGRATLSLTSTRRFGCSGPRRCTCLLRITANGVSDLEIQPAGIRYLAGHAVGGARQDTEPNVLKWSPAATRICNLRTVHEWPNERRPNDVRVDRDWKRGVDQEIRRVRPWVTDDARSRPVPDRIVNLVRRIVRILLQQDRGNSCDHRGSDRRTRRSHTHRYEGPR